MLALTGGTAASERRRQAPRHDAVGALRRHVTGNDTTLADLAMLYDLGYVELVAANPGLDPWLPPTGSIVVIPGLHLPPPAPRHGIVVNFADQRLYLFRNGHVELTFPVGVAAEGIEFRAGATLVVGKRVDPIWTPPASVRSESPDLPASVAPGPDNPLGSRALDLGWPGFVIHGTNRPYGIGRRVSHGCVRLYESDIAQLFTQVPIGTPVRFVDEPVKLGYVDGALHLEIHPSTVQALSIQDGDDFVEEPLVELALRVVIAAGGKSDRIDWTVVEQAARRRTGVPVPILR